MTFTTFPYIFETSERWMISNRKLLHRVNRLVSRLVSFHGQCRAFESIVASYEGLKNEKAQSDDAKLRQIEAWAEKTYMHKLQNVESLDRQDGLHLADLALKQADQKSLEYVSISPKIPGHYALIPQGICISQKHALDSLLFLSHLSLAS